MIFYSRLLIKHASELWEVMLPVIFCSFSRSCVHLCTEDNNMFMFLTLTLILISNNNDAFAFQGTRSWNCPSTLVRRKGLCITNSYLDNLSSTQSQESSSEKEKSRTQRIMEAAIKNPSGQTFGAGKLHSALLTTYLDYCLKKCHTDAFLKASTNLFLLFSTQLVHCDIRRDVHLRRIFESRGAMATAETFETI